MPTINKDRLPELRELLHSHNIDINRVMLRNLDSTGYDYVKEYRDGRPMYENGQFKLATERLEWPHGVWAKVAELAYGVPPKDIDIKTHLKSEAKRLTRKLGVTEEQVEEVTDAAIALAKVEDLPDHARAKRVAKAKLADAQKKAE